jgi:hypothetical protein
MDGLSFVHWLMFLVLVVVIAAVTVAGYIRDEGDGLR